MSNLRSSVGPLVRRDQNDPGEHDDLSALSVLSACRDSGVAVPQQLAVIGVDDLPASALAAPALTTVAMDLTVPAHVLAAHILKAAGAPSRLSGDDGHSPIFTLVQRNTT